MLALFLCMIVSCVLCACLRACWLTRSCVIVDGACGARALLIIRYYVWVRMGIGVEGRRGEGALWIPLPSRFFFFLINKNVMAGAACGLRVQVFGL